MYILTHKEGVLWQGGRDSGKGYDDLTLPKKKSAIRERFALEPEKKEKRQNTTPIPEFPSGGGRERKEREGKNRTRRENRTRYQRGNRGMDGKRDVYPW